MTNYKGIFKQIDLEKVEQYDVEKYKEYFLIKLTNLSHIEFIEFEILKCCDVDIYFSFDKETWTKFKQGQCLLANNKYSLTCNNGEKYQYIKIDTALDNIKDEKINIYVRKFPGLMVAARSDGFGARFLPILNAMYLAEYTGFKFGFVWQKSRYDASSLKEFEGNELAGIYLGEETDIFSGEFIKKYSYTNTIRSDRGFLDKKTIDEICLEPYSKELLGGGWYISQNSTELVFGPQGYQNCLKEYPRLWKQIGFSDVMQKVINDANLSAQNRFPNGFIAIHIRSGDGVYDRAVNSIGIEWRKMMPTEIALELIKRNSKQNIVLFGDDLEQLRKLKLYFKTKINIIEDFIENEDNKGGLRRIMFEIVFMSNAKDIFAGHSSFSEVASYIKLGKRRNFYLHYFSRHEVYSIIKNNLSITSKIGLSPLQSAFSYFFLFRLEHAINDFKNVDKCYQYLSNALSYDRENLLYKIGMIVCLVKMKDYANANKIGLSINKDVFMRHCRKTFFSRVVV